MCGQAQYIYIYKILNLIKIKYMVCKLHTFKTENI